MSIDERMVLIIVNTKYYFHCTFEDGYCILTAVAQTEHAARKLVQEMAKGVKKINHLIKIQPMVMEKSLV